MRMSKSFVPTLKEIPADATVASHQLLVRAGYIRQLAAGIYSILPLGQRSLLKITEIVREEMEAIGAQEFYLPALNPREVWEESGRWSVMGENMFRLKDRKGADLCLAMTHEEIFTVLAGAETPPLEEFGTPGVVTIEALSNKPYGVAADQQLKTLVYMGDDKPLLAIVRGDDQLNEAKLQTASGASMLRPAHAEEIQPLM